MMEIFDGVYMEDIIYVFELCQTIAVMTWHEESLPKLIKQYPEMWNESNFSRFMDDLPQACESKEASREGIRRLRGFREDIERQLLHGPISCDPSLYTLALYPITAAAALALSETFTIPLTRIAILSQVEGGDSRKRTMWQQANRIIVQQGDGGYEGLWRGKWVFVAHRLAFYGIHFSAYTNFNALLQGSMGMRNYPVGVGFVSGGLGALTAASILYPLDTLKTHIAIQTGKEYKGARRTYRSICRDGGGHRSLYRGISASLLRVVPSMAISFSVYEPLSRIWSHLRPDDSLFTTTLVCGTIAGLAASAATYPLEVVQRRLQTENPPPAKKTFTIAGLIKLVNY